MTRPTSNSRANDQSFKPSTNPSLFRWGRDLAQLAPAVQQVQTSHRKVAEEDAALAAAFSRMAQISETDVPADSPLVAEMAAAAQEAHRIAAEEAALDKRRDALAARVEVLPRMYHKHHENDEGRLAGQRGGRQREKGADVGRGEQDV